MEDRSVDADAGPHGGPGGLNSDGLAEGAIERVGAGPRGGPGGFAAEEPGEEEHT